MNDKFHILFLNGPNLNLLSIREPKIYGYKNLSEVVQDLFKLGNDLGVFVDHFQSNAEYELISRLHSVYNIVDFVVINPGGLTHTSIILRDAFLSVNIPFIEVHLSNIYARESYRHHSYLSDIALGVICGFGIHGYYCALHMAIKHLSQSN
ncbi:type II 3-dehydroquinate dehydratase [Blochmannia endosymbiont of Polyrhachis (Hedomyrma) turneri]|uniref:type II 3-dehydroquinate dehydratase n=1 Tax=Blochmannia endosymbiont of Polyrhachis (Hedomyrma) turneri TaxID=1505596 RepID=UPI00061A7A38|nr:type II 3-dehydroquinate dehydratase [Blochmannia endosymbiont of Polyrhachis (Hedomyrma) turneri]AKC59845.1 3-dehydroquinate dehydratase [Blochmannia endosymbiont of Polyrhachis (Hedomyrma) turneri]